MAGLLMGGLVQRECKWQWICTMPKMPVLQNGGVPPASPADPRALPSALGMDFSHLEAILEGKGRAKKLAGMLAAGDDPLASKELGARWREKARRTWNLEGPIASEPVVAKDGTVKFLIHLSDKRAVETVIIPGRNRSTLCVSSQVGCARGCVFCQTATMGLVRNLSCEEILGQVVWARRVAKARGMPPLRNLVFMGMGEALDNLAAVNQAAANLVHPHFFAWAPRHLTLSTVGTSPERIAALRDFPGKIAWSLHAGSDELRQNLVPTTRHSVRALAAAFAEVCRVRGDSLFVEIALLRGINDGPSHAKAVIEVLQDLPSPLRVNLLPMNPIPDRDFGPASPEAVAAFAALIRKAGMICTLRRGRGDDENAACGQLATKLRPSST
jgi:23S rRNA (adenine2503-C2)-methyltransferase